MNAAHLQGIPLPSLAAYGSDEPVESFARDAVVHMALDAGRGRAVAQRVLEGVRVVECRRLHQRERFGELILGLAGKSDDEVGREGDTRYRGPEARDDVEILLAGVPAQHPAENGVG